ncbi:MAG: Jag N-terminal domain-containing protein [Desulfobulbaceae bacterium]|nr:Jag N-terminal domain-containing protein [Desulfobulbaceae bacterium]MCK5436365.1 Jag N-terminal domain-containing protein [Desulfobulbaceae bacterium]MCK5545153.1 Jag N-terminal domain-containing protein [Desulfobulbaceae bacterium]
MSEKKEFKGSDIADAIKKACKSLNASQENLEIEVLHTGSAGIFGLCRKKARILVSVKEKQETEPEAKAALKEIEIKPEPLPASESEVPAAPGLEVEKTAVPDEPSVKKASAPESGKQKKPEPEKIVPGEKSPETKKHPRKSKSDRSKKTAAVKETKKTKKEPEDKQASDVSDKKDKSVEEPAGEEAPQVSAETQEEVRAALVKLLELMEFPSEVTVTARQNKITAHITGEYVDEIVGPEGETLDSIQYLIRKKISREFPGKVMFSLDAGDFRATRAKDLKDLALKLAGEVKETGKTRTIRALGPAERRTVHMVLQNDNIIRSRSVGDGLFKKILIYLPGKGRKKSSYKQKKKGNSSKEKK